MSRKPLLRAATGATLALILLPFAAMIVYAMICGKW